MSAHVYNCNYFVARDPDNCKGGVTFANEWRQFADWSWNDSGNSFQSL